MKKLFFLLTFATICMSSMAQGKKNPYCPNNNHPHIIDLGIGIKWSCCNYGADSPHKFGGYYAWGETFEKRCYESGTYRYYYESTYKYKDIGTDIGGTKYDIVTRDWRDRWRMPTHEEFKLLVKKCSHKTVIHNGIRGMKFTGPNGKSIFLPFGGEFRGENLFGRDEYGSYWSSSVFNIGTDEGALYFGIYNKNKVDTNHGTFRGYGLNIRPVFD